MLDISCESSARQTISCESSAEMSLFFLENDCRLLQFMANAVCAI